LLDSRTTAVSGGTRVAAARDRSTQSMKSRRLLLTAAVLAAAIVGGRAADIVEIRVSGRYFSEPATVRITVAVEPDAANRTLRIEADGDRLYRSTEVTLEGATEKRLHTIEFK